MRAPVAAATGASFVCWGYVRRLCRGRRWRILGRAEPQRRPQRPCKEGASAPCKRIHRPRVGARAEPPGLWPEDVNFVESSKGSRMPTEPEKQVDDSEFMEISKDPAAARALRKALEQIAGGGAGGTL